MSAVTDFGSGGVAFASDETLRGRTGKTALPGMDAWAV